MHAFCIRPGTGLVLALLLVAALFGGASAQIPADLPAVRRAVEDLTKTFGDQYPKGTEYLARLDALAGQQESDALAALGREALLANPLLDFDRLMLVKRGEGQMGLPQNWQSNSSLPMKGYDNELAVLTLGIDAALATLYRPEDGAFVGDVDLHYDADRLLFSMPGGNGRWQIFEMNADGTGLAQLPLIEEPDVDNYDACYLPDGDIMFTSTAPFVGVPCVTGASHVSNLYVLQRETGNIRRLTFEQDHDWCPTVLSNGRVLYLRWEYSDIPHFASRILFHMNPDGTSQMEYYGSNSYWPNAMFYARPIPENPTQFVAVVGGHHDNPRMGELVLFDTAKGRHEADGVIQRIPGYAQTVEPILLDGLVMESWPRFLHPYPLSDKYFLVSCKPTPESRWGIYLVDVFDNMTLLKEADGYALLEPVPLRKTPIPPVIPSRVEPERSDALVYLTDIYAGQGLAGVPRGTVKQLRLFTYHFAYHGMGGQINRVGLDGPWDIKRIMGTVPVEPDGSALFRVPANTPISVQPLDAEGKAIQLMRSWMTAMPGETLSCVGCHEQQNSVVPSKATIAAGREPSEIAPWYGPTRGFSFKREVQPVLDAYCVACHGEERDPDFRPLPPVHTTARSNGYNNGTQFMPSYLALRQFVRAPSMESDMHLLPPGEFHADTTTLVQTLRRGHHGVKLDDEAWNRLITWVDLAAPAHGTWHEIVGEEKVNHQRDRRREMLRRYAGIDEDPEAVGEPAVLVAVAREGGLATSLSNSPPTRHCEESPTKQSRLQGRPVTPSGNEIAASLADSLLSRERLRSLSPTVTAEQSREAIAMTDEADSRNEGGAQQDSPGRVPPSSHSDGFGVSSGHTGQPDPDTQEPARRTIDLGEGITIELVLLPAPQPASRHPFWMGVCEVTNAQYARFDPDHDSRLEHGDFLQFSVEERGYPLNGPNQPVVRISWNQATAFCDWLSSRLKEDFSLPTELQWEHACRAGATTPMWYGDLDADFSESANLADASLHNVDTFKPWSLPSGAIHPWRPAVTSVNDGHRVSAPVGSFAPNAWGLCDMAGNAAEWCRTTDADSDRQPARGGSWYDRPKNAQSSSRVTYAPWQPVFNVGFRVVCKGE
jgi:Sulfatase-modifying factor enzyme 1/Hydrazine synthase alpha subunit middle domain